MGSMWIDPTEDPKVYPTIPTAGLPVPGYDENAKTSAMGFPERAWGADFVSMVALIEFTRYVKPKTKLSWQDIVAQGIDPPPGRDSDEMEKGLKSLIEMQREDRTALLPEILAQSGDFQMYFCAQLGLYPRTHPKSYQLLKNAARMGEIAMVYLKMLWSADSVRPSHIYPRLMPPIQVPPHASYPSGHAMISRLLALVANEIVPKLGDAADNLSKRIARNREVAGLHFYFDTDAGRIAAQNVFDIYVDLFAFQGEIDAAKAEWLPSS